MVINACKECVSCPQVTYWLKLPEDVKEMSWILEQRTTQRKKCARRLVKIVDRKELQHKVRFLFFSFFSSSVSNIINPLAPYIHVVGLADEVHLFRKRKKPRLLSGGGAINIGTWFLCVMWICENLNLNKLSINQQIFGGSHWQNNCQFSTAK